MFGPIGRRALVATSIMAGVCGAASPAWATNGIASANASSTGVTATATSSTPSATGNGLVSVGVGGSSGGSSGPSGSSGRPPQYVVVPVPQGATPGAYVFPTSFGSSTYLPPASRFGQFFPNLPYCPGYCPLPTTSAAASASGAAAPAAGPSPVTLAIDAMDHANFGAATIQTSPPVGQAVVNFRTWVKVTNWAPVVASASAGPVTSTVTATPTTLTLSAPDSHSGGAFYHTISATCTGPGKAYIGSIPFAAQHSACELTWRWPSYAYGNGYGDSYPLSVSVTYHVTWTAAGAPGGGTLPDVTHTTTFPFLVREIQVIGVPTP
jgi:hypothetical protein